MFGFLKRKRIEDPVFGTLVRGWRKWTGKRTTDLFPGVELRIEIHANNEDELDRYRRHFEAVIKNRDKIQKEIEEAAFETYQMYKEAEGEELHYPELKPGEIGKLIRPLKWTFSVAESWSPRKSEPDFLSLVLIDFGWPNDHWLMAELQDDALFVIDVVG